MQSLRTISAIFALLFTIGIVACEETITDNSINGWDAKVTINGESKMWLYFFVDVDKSPIWIGFGIAKDHAKSSVAIGRYQQDKDEWSIRFSSGGNEKALVRRPDDDTMEYHITEHSDKLQKGLKVNFARMTITGAEAKQLREIAVDAKSRLDRIDAQKKAESELPLEHQLEILRSNKRIVDIYRKLLD